MPVRACDPEVGDRRRAYLRHSTVRKDGKTHTYWRPVRSVRRGGKVSQQTVAHLGELDAQGRARAQALARQITGRAEQYELFEDRTPASTSVEVRLDRVRLERSRNFGDVWLGWTLWRALELDQLCDELMLVGREQIPWPTMAAILTIARLCEPSSELHIAEDWYRRTSLEDLLGVLRAPERGSRWFSVPIHPRWLRCSSVSYGRLIARARPWLHGAFARSASSVSRLPGKARHHERAGGAHRDHVAVAGPHVAPVVAAQRPVVAWPGTGPIARQAHACIRAVLGRPHTRASAETNALGSADRPGR